MKTLHLPFSASKDDAFCLRSGTRKECALPPLYSTEVLARAIRHGKNKAAFRLESKNENYLYLQMT